MDSVEKWEGKVENAFSYFSDASRTSEISFQNERETSSIVSLWLCPYHEMVLF